MLTLDRTEMFQRQAGILPEDVRNQLVTIIGVGAVGSVVTLGVAKAGINPIAIYDFDEVSLHNIPNQFYRLNDVGKPKVNALYSIVKGLSGVLMEVHQEAFDCSVVDNEYLIVACDGLDTRRDILSKIKNDMNRLGAYFECRMGAGVFRLFSFIPDSVGVIEAYEKTLYETAEPEAEPCTQRATSYMSLIAGGLVTNAIRQMIQFKTGMIKNPPPYELLLDINNNIMQTKRVFTDQAYSFTP